jgi:DNA-binding MarR family transcriptional regulator
MSSSIHRALDFVAARRAAGLTDETMQVLLLVSMRGRQTKDELAAQTRINPTTLPRYLAGLVASGHLLKRQDPEDRRIILFEISPHGRRLVDSLLRHFPA